MKNDAEYFLRKLCRIASHHGVSGGTVKDRVLLIDDDGEILEMNRAYLEHVGYEVFTAESAEKAMDIVSETQPNCIVLDIMMPGMSGLEACGRLRALTAAPILFLTGKSSEEDRIQGLLVGGDDYIIKPYSMGELSARILAHIRRTKSASVNVSELSFPPLSIDLLNRTVLINGMQLAMPNREFEVLALLARNAGSTVAFAEINQQLWKTTYDGDRRAIMVHVSGLRKKLEAVGMRCIETIYGEGYRFVYPPEGRS